MYEIHTGLQRMASNINEHGFNAKLHSTDFDLRFNKRNDTPRNKNKKEKIESEEKDSRAKKQSSVNEQCQECRQFYRKKVFDKHSTQCRLLQKGFATDIGCHERRIPKTKISQKRFVIHSIENERNAGKKMTIPTRKQGLFEQERELAWGQFEHTCSMMPRVLVRFEDIPFLQEGALVEASSIRALLIRWHPDHFLQRFGTKLFPGDVPSIQMKLNATIRFLSSLKKGVKFSK